ncbi:TcpD family membrane protein [Enterococcus casseliflavus]|uniref:TcpD family membrane protein n=1 Tax=Enterococcus casseliflavus TaxID=37734 RepID=UPI0018AC690F|nr:TcpD family membrane protein [Enterococcus casseliflavus]
MPTTSGILDYAKKEGINIVWIILIGFAIKFFYKQEWGKAVGFLAGGGLVAYIVNNPQVVSQAFEKVSQMIFK